MEAVVQVENVSLRFGRTWVLTRLDFQVPKHACLLITGGNGAGKTTLLRVLATALKPTRGTLKLFGQDAYEDIDRARLGIALLTHQPHVYDELSARENLRLVKSLCPWTDGEVDNLLEEVNLQDHSDRSVGNFSAGMKRRLCTARMLMQEPTLALLDEPFAQLDPEGVALMETLIRRMRDKGTTVIFSTHNVERGLALADHHIKLHLGQLQGQVEKLQIMEAAG